MSTAIWILSYRQRQEKLVIGTLNLCWHKNQRINSQYSGEISNRNILCTECILYVVYSVDGPSECALLCTNVILQCVL